MIKQAPISLILAWALGCVLLYFFFKWKYRERIAAKNELLANKDDLISYYREKLGLSSDTTTARELVNRPQAEAEIAAIKDGIASIQAGLNTSTKDGLTFESDPYMLRSQVRIDRFDDNDDAVDDPLTRTYCLNVDLRIRFKNTSVHPIGVEALDFSIVATSGAERPLTNLVQPLTIQHPNSSEKSAFESLRVEGSDTTVYYAFVCLLGLPTDCALLLDKYSFLRITMKATRQQPNFHDYQVPWKRAFEQYVPIALRPEGREGC